MSLFLVVPVVANAAGTGTKDDPIKLDAAGLKKLEQGQMSGSPTQMKYYELTEDAELTKPINYIYDAHFNGNGHTVTLNINETYTPPSNVPGVGMFAYAYNTVEIENLIIKGEAVANSTHTHTHYAAYGGLIGFVQAGTVTISNVTNNAKIGSQEGTGGNKGSGGIIGIIRSNSTRTVKLTDCFNTGEIISGLYAAGLVGYLYETKTAASDLAENAETFMHLEIINGSNIGTLTGNECSGAVNIKGPNSSDFLTNVSINKFYNSGSMTGSQLIAIAKMGSTGGASVFNIENCFNVADTTNATSNNFFAYNYDTKGYIKNSYNAGKVKYAMYANDINTLYGENYYVLENSVTTANNNYGGLNREDVKVVTIDDLDGPELPTGFSDTVWEYVKGSDYIYPQLKGNTYMAGKPLPETLTATATSFVPDAAEDISGTYADGDISYTGKYIFAFSTAADITGYSKVFGMKIEKDGNAEEANAEPGSDKDGKYGILFYGSNLTTGQYKITPFVKYTALDGTEEKTIYGTQTTVDFTE